MSRLVCTFRRFLEIIGSRGFVETSHGATSHRQFRGEHSGTVWIVTVAYHRVSDDIPIGTLKAMIRQTGLNPKLFRR